MKIQAIKQSMQHRLQAVMSAYWLVNHAPAGFNSLNDYNRGTEITGRVREGWDD